MNLGPPGHLRLGENLKRLRLGGAHVCLEKIGLEGGRGRLGAR